MNTGNQECWTSLLNWSTPKIGQHPEAIINNHLTNQLYTLLWFFYNLEVFFRGKYFLILLNTQSENSGLVRICKLISTNCNAKQIL